VTAESPIRTENSPRQLWLTLVAMTLAGSMILVDQTAVPLALPDISQDLSVGTNLVQWVLTGSLLPLAGLLPSVVSGGVLSNGSRISHSYSDASTWAISLDESVATTRSRCSPWSRPLYSYGELHGVNGSRSSEHSKVASATLASNSIVPEELCDSPPVAGSPWVPGVKPGPAVKWVAREVRHLGDDFDTSRAPPGSSRSLASRR